jgi:hypothetical protein
MEPEVRIAYAKVSGSMSVSGMYTMLNIAADKSWGSLLLEL